jgi:hypothetical protein
MSLLSMRNFRSLLLFLYLNPVPFKISYIDSSKPAIILCFTIADPPSLQRNPVVVDLDWHHRKIEVYSLVPLPTFYHKLYFVSESDVAMHSATAKIPVSCTIGNAVWQGRNSDSLVHNTPLPHMPHGPVHVCVSIAFFLRCRQPAWPGAIVAQQWPQITSVQEWPEEHRCSRIVWLQQWPTWCGVTPLEYRCAPKSTSFQTFYSDSRLSPLSAQAHETEPIKPILNF